MSAHVVLWQPESSIYQFLSGFRNAMQAIKSTAQPEVDTVYTLGWQCEETAAVQGTQHLPRASILWQVRF